MDQSLFEVERAEDITRVIEEYGVCILKNVLNEQECQGIVDGMVKTFQDITVDLRPRFEFSKSSSWKTLEHLFPIRSMLYQHWGLGHAQFVWDVRCNPKVINAFATIWGTNDLLVSFDGIAFHLPPERSGKRFVDKDAYHVDQSFTRCYPDCIQGWINGFDTNEGDATIKLLVGSHKHFQEFGTVNNITSPDDWHVIKDIDFYLQKGCIEHRVTCPKGSLVLWDSRTVHFGASALKTRAKPNCRAVVYLCYTPKSRINETKRQKKISYFENLRMTSHWPHNPKLFPVHPRTYGAWLPTNEIKPISKPVIEKQYYPLIGYNEGEY
jgi:ectoine hydroxylase-related dioxygenase (phytanoyl-CoA dioxygenase family)